MANQTPGNQNQDSSGDNEEFHSPEEANAAPAVEQQPRAGNSRPRRRGLRSNTVIPNRPQDVGAIIERSRSRNRNRNPDPDPESSDDDDDANSNSGDSANVNNNQAEDEAKRNEPPPSSSSSSVHPERQDRVDQANANAVAQAAQLLASAIHANANASVNAPENENDDNENANANAPRPRRPPIANNVNVDNPQNRSSSRPVPSAPAQSPQNVQARQYQSRRDISQNWYRQQNRGPRFMQPGPRINSANSRADNNQMQQPVIPSPMSNQLAQLQQQLQLLTTQVNRISSASPAPAVAVLNLPGLTEQETKLLTQPDDRSDFYARKQTVRNIQFIDDKAARKLLQKECSDKLENIKNAIDWFDKFDYRCDQWGIPYPVRYKTCITRLFPDELMEQLRAAQQTEDINNYADLKRWIFKQRNTRRKIAKADKAITTWIGKDSDTTFQQYVEFAAICNKYAREINFGLDWGLKAHEINRIPEELLFDIFIDNASAKDKLWQIYYEKVNGRRTMLKAKLMARHMTYLEQHRTTKSQTHRKKKSKSKKRKHSVNAIQTENDRADKPKSNRYNSNNYKPYRGRGRGRRHTSRWRYNKNKRNRGPHNPPHNCKEYGHSPDDCWVLHPEKRPNKQKRAAIFALQRKINKAEDQIKKGKNDLRRAIDLYEQSTESSHDSSISSSDEESERKANDANDTSTSEEDRADTESSSPNYAYRPRQ